MRMPAIAAVLFCTTALLAATQAEARPYHHHHYSYRHHYASRHYGRPHFGYGYAPRFIEGVVRGVGNFAAAVARGLPSCGAYMADRFGFSGQHGRELWLARNWAHEGRATSPHPGAVAVYPHHVVEIVGGQDSRGRWLVQDNHGGRGGGPYYRSLAGTIAIRDPRA